MARSLTAKLATPLDSGSRTWTQSCRFSTARRTLIMRARFALSADTRNLWTSRFEAQAWFISFLKRRGFGPSRIVSWIPTHGCARDAAAFPGSATRLNLQNFGWPIHKTRVLRTRRSQNESKRRCLTARSKDSQELKLD